MANRRVSQVIFWAGRVSQAIPLLQESAKEKFWANVQLDIQDGEVTLIRKTETIKVNNGMENNRRNDKNTRQS